MAAAVYIGEGKIAVQELSVPVPGPDEVLVRVSHCGVCGTDLHLVLEGYARAGSVLGHEWSGTVVASGEDVDGWEPGAHVVATPTPGCGVCRACTRGRPSVCLRRAPADLLSFRGAFCEYLTVRAHQLARIPDQLTIRGAALTEPTAIAIHTVNLAGVASEDRVLITGAGPVGLLTIAVLRARGVDDITVTEPSPVRRERALAVGAGRAVGPEILARAPMGRPVDEPYTVAFECSGRASAAEAALDQLDYAGTMMFVGTGREFPRVNHNRAIVLELTIMGAYNYDADGFAPALELLASGIMPLELLIEPDDVPLSGLLGTMEALSRGEIPGKVLVDPAVPS
jgi:2-desacetyl-2-hydroxyethyl bacteriochlorophyllide A dehydrogenase